MANNTETKYPVWIQIVTCLFGVTLYMSSFHPTIVSLADLTDILQQLGVGVLVFGITAFFITHRYNVIASRQMEKVSDEMKSLTIEAFDLVRNARDSGIERIFPLRTGESSDKTDSKNEFRERIKKEFQSLQESKDEITVRMVGISFRDFFSNLGLLKNVTDNLLNNENVSFEILLINPFSTQAGYRAEREAEERYQTVEDHFVSTLFQDIQQCTKNIEKYDSDRVAVRFYSTAPSCMLIFINQSVFIETYHYGRAGVGGLKGGKIPVLEFHRGTHAYKELEGHFEYVWEKAEDCQLDEEIRENILAPRKQPVINELKKNLYWVTGTECMPKPSKDNHIMKERANKANSVEAKNRAPD